MQVQYDKTIGCCCYYQKKRAIWDFETNKSFDLEKYWNGKYFTKIRRIIKAGYDDYTGCRNCQFIEYNTLCLPEDPPDHLNSKQASNYIKAFYNFKNKKIYIDNYPVRYYFNFGLACNLNCVMCSQAAIRKKNYAVLPTEIFDLFEEYFTYAEQVTIIGGEPFVIPQARNFIKKFNTSDRLSDVRLSIITNGTLLHHYMDYFNNIKKMNLCISIDSSASTYEQIRRGASWSQLEKNINNLISRKERRNRQWTITLAAVLMKSSLRNLVPFVKWLSQKHLRCNFVPITSTMLNKNEDIFSYPQLLDTIPDWYNSINEAIELLQNHMPDAAIKLKIMRDKLIKLKKLYDNNPALFSASDVKITEILLGIQDKKFLIWGTASFYELYLQDPIKQASLSNFLGFVDNDPKKWGQTKDNMPIYRPDQINSLQPDIIIIASAMRQEIITQIRNELGITCKII